MRRIVETRRRPRRQAYATISLLADQNSGPLDTTSYQRKFRRTMLMATTLLRIRLVDHGFMNPATSRETLALLAELENSIRRMTNLSRRLQAPAHRNRLMKNVGIVNEIIEYINHRGQDPNIIQRLFAEEEN